MFVEGYHQQYVEHRALLQQISADYHADPALRARIDGGDARPVMDVIGVDQPEGLEIRVVTNTPEVWHLPMPMDPNKAVTDLALSDIAAGSTAGCAATTSTAGTFACSTTASTLGSGGTVSTASTES